jgi:hypothetical protein
MDIAQISVIISASAFVVAAYGILERRITARRAERIRLTTIVEDLTKTRLELYELASNGITMGDRIEALNTRLEVLSQQALSLIRQHSLTITSTECREVAFDLMQAGYQDNAEFMWNLARERAQKEGGIQALFASRGYAYFLFHTQREDEAREILRNALSDYAADTEPQRLQHIQTLRQWILFEYQTEGPQSNSAHQLEKQVAELGKTFTTEGAKARLKITLGDMTIPGIEGPKS